MMHLFLLELIQGVLAVIGIHTLTAENYAAPCYSAPLPSLTPNYENRTIPWGSPSFTLPNGTVCCDTLSQVRIGINAVDDQLLALLAQRVAYG